MSAVMLLFALAGNGRTETWAISFPSMAVCEAARGGVMQQIVDRGAEYAATVCVIPTKGQGA